MLRVVRQRSPTECGVSECISSKMRRPWPSGGFRTMGRGEENLLLTIEFIFNLLLCSPQIKENKIYTVIEEVQFLRLNLYISVYF